MKYRGIRRPKKAKKVTLERIREIVREEMQATVPPVFVLNDAQREILKHTDFSKERRTAMPINYDKPDGIQKSGTAMTVSPPPLVSARYKDQGKTNLPDGFSSEIEETD